MVNLSSSKEVIIKPFFKRLKCKSSGKYLGEMVRYCKEELDIESVTVVTNGSRVTEAWMSEYGYYLDIMAVSVDSFDEEVNDKIGRRSGKSGSSHLESLSQVRDWCRMFSVLFKVNTVVNKHNFHEDMNDNIRFDSNKTTKI